MANKQKKYLKKNKVIVSKKQLKVLLSVAINTGLSNLRVLEKMLQMSTVKHGYGHEELQVIAGMYTLAVEEFGKVQYLKSIKPDGKGRYIIIRDKKLENHIKSNTKWFELMVRTPRNIIFVHDFKTTGSGGGDHGIDFGITKSTEKRNAQKPTDNLRRMKKDHLTDFPELKNENNAFQIIRVFDHNSEKLSLDEINGVKQIHEQIGGMFPYVVEVNKKLQELLDFFTDWTKDKILKSNLSPHIP